MGGRAVKTRQPMAARPSPPCPASPLPWAPARGAVLGGGCCAAAFHLPPLPPPRTDVMAALSILPPMGRADAAGQSAVSSQRCPIGRQRCELRPSAAGPWSARQARAAATARAPAASPARPPRSAATHPPAAPLCGGAGGAAGRAPPTRCPRPTKRPAPVRGGGGARPRRGRRLRRPGGGGGAALVGPGVPRG